MNPVSVRAVTRDFGSFRAVDAVDLEVEAGEIVGLVGANGAGKTTLIRMILGLLRPTAGVVRLFGEPQSRRQRTRIGYVPQNLGLYRDLTARENLEFIAASFGMQRGVVASAPDGLVRDLPLGVRRRVAFRAATEHEPDLLVLDEPTSGVSPLARSRLWDEIRSHAEAGTGVLVSTHYMDEADQADRVVLMSAGRVAGEGSVDQIVGDRRVVEVEAEDWSAAFAALDRSDRLVTLSGASVRVLDATPARVQEILGESGVTGRVTETRASLEETMALLGT